MARAIRTHNLPYLPGQHNRNYCRDCFSLRGSTRLTAVCPRRDHSGLDCSQGAGSPSSLPGRAVSRTIFPGHTACLPRRLLHIGDRHSTILSPEGFLFPGQNPGCLKGVGILSRKMTMIGLFLRAKIFRTKLPGFDPKPFCPENPHWRYAIRYDLSQVGRSPGARGQRA